MTEEKPEVGPAGGREGFEPLARPFGETSPLREEVYDSDICSKKVRESKEGEKVKKILLVELARWGGKMKGVVGSVCILGWRPSLCPLWV